MQVAWDWANQTHDVTVMDDDGRIVDRFELTDDEVGPRRLIAEYEQECGIISSPHLLSARQVRRVPKQSMTGSKASLAAWPAIIDRLRGRL